jgi:NADH-quinone oxidoreductase subunit I
MNGLGIVRGLGVALKHFFDSYFVEIRDKLAGKKHYYTPESIAERSSYKARGVFTIQYPEEKAPVPEEFRYIPFLLYEEGENGEKNLRCTSCGICAKVCPPQCIWIVRTTDPNTGRPVPAPAEFAIDVDICMNCGLCAEFCPFDAIKMDHDYEIASFDRHNEHIFNIQKLSKPVSYYSQIRPTNYAREEAARQAEKEAKAARKAGAPAGD